MANDSNTNSNYSIHKTTGVIDSLAEYISIVTADETTYEVFTDEFEYTNKQLVYKLVEQDSINPVDGTVLDNFHVANQNSAIDKFTEAQRAIANNDISAVNSANNSAPVSNHLKVNNTADN